LIRGAASPVLAAPLCRASKHQQQEQATAKAPQKIAAYMSIVQIQPEHCLDLTTA
jgi:hypothetical protein